MTGNGSRLRGQVALITGAAKRLGRAIAEELSHHGAGVVVHYRSSGHAAPELVATLQAAGVGAWAIQADLKSDSLRSRRGFFPSSICSNAAGCKRRRSTPLQDPVLGGRAPGAGRDPRRANRPTEVGTECEEVRGAVMKALDAARA